MRPGDGDLLGLIAIIKFFEDVLGYDGMVDVSREANVKYKYVDIVLKVDNVVRLLVEAKAASGTLRDRHTEQAEGYAAKGNPLGRSHERSEREQIGPLKIRKRRTRRVTSPVPSVEAVSSPVDAPADPSGAKMHRS